MKHLVYNHNRDLYISYPIQDGIVIKSGNIICHGDLALFIVKPNETEIEVRELIKKRCPDSVNVDLIYDELLHILILYKSGDEDHVKYLQQAVIESDQFKNAITVNFTGLSSDSLSQIVTADFNLPMQHKFIHLITLSLRYAKG